MEFRASLMSVVCLSFLAFDGTVAFIRRGEPINGKHPADVYYQDFVMPGVTPTKKDQYLCTAVALNSTVEEWILKYEPLASADRAHHMLLYGCSGVSHQRLKEGYWDCLHHGVCSGGSVIYAWAKNAPATHLPRDVGFLVGGNTSIKYLTLQIHYAKPLESSQEDHSGLRMTLTQKPQKYKAGIYLLLSPQLDIPPYTEKTHADLNCKLNSQSDINIFAFRTHAHALGTVITGYKYDPVRGELVEIVRGNPQWPQAFYPVGDVITVKPNDVLHARCTFNSSTRGRHTYIGSTSDDEMCNLYLMYYTDRDKGPKNGMCAYEMSREITDHLPEDSDEPLPPNPLLEEMTHGDNTNKDKEITYNKALSQSGLHTPDLSDFTPSVPSQKRKGIVYYKELHMPGVTPSTTDAYICTGVPLNATEEWVLEYEPLASASRAHHMLLFGCPNIDPEVLQRGYWDCRHHEACTGSYIMYAWAKNAPSTLLPDGVGFRIGGDSGIKFLALQIHYAHPLPKSVRDYSGLKIKITTQPQRYKAGIFLLAAGIGTIPPRSPKTNIDLNCLVGDTEPRDINLFAFRVHGHSLATVISGYKFDPKINHITQIAKGNPQWPQAFYPLDRIQRITPEDVLHARCTFNSSSTDKSTHIGQTSGDEMCNLYLMYYTDRKEGSEIGGCYWENFPLVTSSLPANSDVPLPPNPQLELLTHGENKNKDNELSFNNLFAPPAPPIEVEKKTHVKKKLHPVDEPYPLRPKPVYDYENTPIPPLYEQDVRQNHLEEHLVSVNREGKQLSNFQLVENWGPKEYVLGQVTAVAVDSRGDVVIFHRGDVVWDGSAFRGDGRLVNKSRVIIQPTLLHLQSDTGNVMHEWGANFFHMPHGLTIDTEDNIWVTDVGLHQVFQFPSGYGEGRPLLTLGTKFEPGKDDRHFCKPSSVAVLKNGEFFVSDGYCNARIIHYSPAGNILNQFGSDTPVLRVGHPPLGTFRVPHHLTLAEDRREICVSDRENGRVLCFDIKDGSFKRIFQLEQWGKRLFSAAYTPHSGGKLFAVNGPQYYGGRKKVQIFEVGYDDGKLITQFSPYNQGLSNPHDITVSSNGTELYVVEIGPNKVWKFAVEGARKNTSGLTTKSVTPKIEVQTGQLSEKVDSGKMNLFSGEWSALGVSLVILGLLAVPIVVLSVLSLVIWGRKNGSRKLYVDRNGKFGRDSYPKNGGLNLGSLLNKHHGFEKLSTNDVDDDDLESADSDVEEFNLAAAKV